VLASLGGAAPLDCAPVRAVSRRLSLGGFRVPAEDLARARGLLALPEPPARTGDLTSEDIFRGDPGVERIFARRLLEVAGSGPAEHAVPLQHVRLGQAGFSGIPGEPFVEIGLALKCLPGLTLSIPVGLANGYLGYIPVAHRYGAGGYEVKPGPALLARGSAERILAELGEMAAEARVAG
jgi:neutral ceramidase